jgi:hypothetical protein
VGQIIESADDLGIVTVGKNSHIPTGLTVARGVRIGSDLRPDDFAQYKESGVPDGEYIHSKDRMDY